MAAMGVIDTSIGRSPDPAFWDGTRVLVTGHTGFKGAWLTRWLALLGAEVHGLALDPPSSPAAFHDVAAAEVLRSDHRVDLRSGPETFRVVERVAPEVVLHLAAQSLVREGYREPGLTYATNVTGTAHLLEALARSTTRPRSVIVVTSDKVYRPHADGRAHIETDALGGRDPYSSSKALAEGVVDAFRHLPAIDGRAAWDVPIASARAGNVIGGGDWARDRLVPDCIRSFTEGETITLRYPRAVRPWQHVLEPLSGYLVLAEDLAKSASAPDAVNFGPLDPRDGGMTVAELAREVAVFWGADERLVVERADSTAPETQELRLDSSLAASSLGWRPRWDTGEALRRTVDWYRANAQGVEMAHFTDAQIQEYAGA